MQTAIVINSLCESYAAGSESAALSDVSLDLRAGEFDCRGGCFGSGKSTLLKLLAGIEQPTSGTARIISEEIRPRIGFVFQAEYSVSLANGGREFGLCALELQGISKVERREVARKLCTSGWFGTGCSAA